MTGFVVRRLGLVAVTFLGVTVLAFGLIHALPGDPVELLFGERGADPERLAEMRRMLGLDQPLLAQYLHYVARVFHGDLGRSLVRHEAVLDEFLTLFPATVELSLCAMLLAVALGMPAGILAAVRHGTAADYGVMSASLTGYSMPIFWWAILLILLFSVTLGITPVSGRISVEYYVEPRTGFMLVDAWLSDEPGALRSALSHLVLPAVALGTVPMAVIARMTRSAMLEVLNEDYIRTARAKGVHPFRVVGRHALRNALLPVVTIVGLQVGSLFGGAVLTETIFAWPGIGKWLIEGVNRRDYPVLQGGILLVAAVVILVNLMVDVLTGLANPRTPDRGLNRPIAVPGRAVRADAPVRLFARRYARSVSGRIGLALVAALVALALLAPVVAGHDPAAQDRAALLRPPGWLGGSAAFPLGTDDVGRDILARLAYGARLSLSVGLVVVSLALSAGTLLGLVAGFAQGLADALIMRLIDIMLALPTLLLAIAIVAVLGPGLGHAMLAVAVVQLPPFVRLTRAAVRAELVKDYVLASRAVGAGRARLMFRTVLPNCLAPLIVQASLSFSVAILDTAALGFLGLGAQPPTPEWGTMLADALQFVQSAWWVVTFPGLAILLSVLGFNLMGDGLRDALDPRLRR